jgi:hypothetical protein
MRLTRVVPAVILCEASSVVAVALVVAVAALALTIFATLARRVVVVVAATSVDTIVVFEASERVGRRREGRVVVGIWDGISARASFLTSALSSCTRMGGASLAFDFDTSGCRRREVVVVVADSFSVAAAVVDEDTLVPRRVTGILAGTSTTTFFVLLFVFSVRAPRLRLPGSMFSCWTASARRVVTDGLRGPSAATAVLLEDVVVVAGAAFVERETPRRVERAFSSLNTVARVPRTGSRV